MKPATGYRWTICALNESYFPIMKRVILYLVVVCVHVFILLHVLPVYATVRLPQLVGNHMVLQRDRKIKIWGWASPGEKVSIRFNGIGKTASIGADGVWMTEFPAMPAGGPFSMVITGKNVIELSDILIGDVWFCSGQSNMVIPMERIKEKYPEEVAHDSFPEIRNFFVPTRLDPTKLYDDLPPGHWTSAVGADLIAFGGLTYFFAKKLYLAYHIPIGIINSSVGGYPIEAWMSVDAINQFPKQEAQLKNLRDTNYMKRLASVRSVNTTTGPIPLTDEDKGISGPIPWTSLAYVPENWHKFWLPGYWADQGVKGLHGIVYFRKEIEVPASMTGVAARLFLGRIVDADSTFVNGQFVGNITYQYPPRRYVLAAGLLKPGKNIIVIKLVNSAGKGGFTPDKNYSLVANGERIDLRGEWIYQVGQVLKYPGAETHEADDYNPQTSLTGLFNTMVQPATRYAIKGFLWYQGEANTGNPKDYAKYLPVLIRDWREKWNEGDIPFLFAQLPGYMEVEYSPSESNWAQLRQSQLEALTVPNTGMAVTIDAGEWNDIHPLNKKDVGERLALWAEHLCYGSKDPDYSGPVYRSYAIDGNKVILNFSQVGTGLAIKGGGDLYYFSVAGADKKYVWARAKIVGDQILVWSEKIPNPVYVRYAWANNPEGANLYNKKGLPASPFETENN
jgi:sialate O-acetylesterase